MENDNFLNELAQLMQSRYFMNAFRLNMHKQYRSQARGKSRLLQLIAEHDGLTNTEIVEILDIRPSSVSLQVKGLEDAGLIERRDNEKDKRVSLIYLTDKGRAMLDQNTSVTDESIEKMLAGLTEDEQVELTRILKKLNEQVEQLDESDFDFMKHGKRPGFGGFNRGPGFHGEFPFRKW